jgi:hypothetical protein
LQELANLRATQPAYPEGNPAGNWSGEELRSFIDAKDAELATQPRPKPQLRLDNLSPEQLRQVAQATTQQQVDVLLDQFTKGAK